MATGAGTIAGAGGGLFAAQPLRGGQCRQVRGQRVTARSVENPHQTRLPDASGLALCRRRDPSGRRAQRWVERGRVSLDDADWRRCKRNGVCGEGCANLLRFVNAGGYKGATDECTLTRTWRHGFKANRDVQRAKSSWPTTVEVFGALTTTTRAPSACYPAPQSRLAPTFHLMRRFEGRHPMRHLALPDVQRCRLLKQRNAGPRPCAESHFSDADLKTLLTTKLSESNARDEPLELIGCQCRPFVHRRRHVQAGDSRSS